VSRGENPLRTQQHLRLRRTQCLATVRSFRRLTAAIPQSRQCFGSHTDSADEVAMKRSVEQILRIEVPLLVQLAEREMTLGQVLELTPGTIIELPKTAEE